MGFETFPGYLAWPACRSCCWCWQASRRSRAAEGEKPPAPEGPWSVELHLKRYFGSHTSYEFGNPEFRRSFSRFSAGLEVLRSVSGESDGSFKDSDWDDDTQPSVKNVYSESQSRIEPSYMVRGDVDLKVADWLGLPAGFDLRPVVGVRWQRLELLAHDGVQVYPAPGDDTPPNPLPGDIIRSATVRVPWEATANSRLGIASFYSFSHFNRRTSFMVRMDNLSAVILTFQVFPESSIGFHWVYPA